jgi:hyperosmotically inducible protein
MTSRGRARPAREKRARFGHFQVDPAGTRFAFLRERVMKRPQGTSSGAVAEVLMKSRYLAFVFAVALSSLGAATVASAAQSDDDRGTVAIDTSADRTNYSLFKDVAQQVNSYPRFTVFDDISANIDNGVVTLSGNVTMPYKSDDLAKRIAKINGVTAVQNKIQVLPVSMFDDELRFRIARAIYGNSAFWQYAAMANPPIHIVVKNGNVTLTGVVNSEVERALARSLATGFGEFSVKNELKTDAEMKTVLEHIN